MIHHIGQTKSAVSYIYHILLENKLEVTWTNDREHKYPIKIKYIYIIQYRHPILAACDAYWTYRKSSKKWKNVLAHAGPDKFLYKYLKYWSKFSDKWIINGPPNSFYLYFDNLVLDSNKTMSNLSIFLSKTLKYDKREYKIPPLLEESLMDKWERKIENKLEEVGLSTWRQSY